jgi:hypothetical protein
LFKNAGPKPFWWANPDWFYFSASNFNLQSHILSTSGLPLISGSPSLPSSDTRIYHIGGALHLVWILFCTTTVTFFIENLSNSKLCSLKIPYCNYITCSVHGDDYCCTSL